MGDGVLVYFGNLKGRFEIGAPKNCRDLICQRWHSSAVPSFDDDVRGNLKLSCAPMLRRKRAAILVTEGTGTGMGTGQRP
jgi:hypothetical protein